MSRLMFENPEELRNQAELHKELSVIMGVLADLMEQGEEEGERGKMMLSLLELYEEAVVKHCERRLKAGIEYRKANKGGRDVPV